MAAESTGMIKVTKSTKKVKLDLRGILKEEWGEGLWKGGGEWYR